MIGSSIVEGCLVRDPVPWDTLSRALADVLEIDPAEIGAFDGETPIPIPPPVLVEMHERKSGFRLDLTLYLRIVGSPGITGVALAQRLASALGQEVLTSPPAGEDGGDPAPDRWVLARPDGSLAMVRQVDPESDDIEIDRDPSHMERIDIPDAR